MNNLKCEIVASRAGDVSLSGFLGAKMSVNREVSIPSLYLSLKKHGTIDNFRIAAERKPDIAKRSERTIYADSDLYKWMEAVSRDLENKQSPENLKLLDSLIELVGQAQRKSGYLNTYYSVCERQNIFRKLSHSHELYCGGHLIEAAVAHYRVTGRDNFLDIAIRWADFICEKFGPGGIGQNDGHPEVEMALVELYRVTGKREYLELAAFLMSQQYVILDGFSFMEFPEMTGHAVRMLYLCCGAADYCAETGDGRYLEKLLSLWDDMSKGKVYITGGVGARYRGESFGMPYELPNLRAYAESCASIASMMWSYRMFMLTGSPGFMDLFEETLYNGFLSGVSFDGSRYFYTNPLASRGEHERAEWYKTTCCPPNIQRMIAALPGYFYAADSEGVFVNLYGESDGHIKLPSGGKVRVLQRTEYPWEGRVSMEVVSEVPGITLFLRIPRWAESPVVKAFGKNLKPRPGTYFRLETPDSSRRSCVEINFNMKPAWYMAHPEIDSTKNAFAIKRGPLVYCLESVDNPGINLFDLAIRGDNGLSAVFESEFLGGAYTVTGELHSARKGDLPLYGRAESYPVRGRMKSKFKAIPYHLWANRGKSRMVTWLAGEK